MTADFETEDELLKRRDLIIARMNAGKVDLVAADSIEAEAIDWLWRGWLARGKLHLLAGNVGAGKTTLALSLAATLSTGGQFPDGTRTQAGDVLFWSGEDDPADSLVPRFLACGGDPARLVFARGVHSREGKILPFDPARDLAALGQAMADLPDLALLVVDPIVSVVAGDTDKNAAARRALTAMVRLAAAHDIAILGIGHFGKTRRSNEPVHRFLGAHSFVQVARLIMATAKSNDGTRLLVRIKSNIGPDGGGFAFTFGQSEVGEGVTGQRIEWGEAVQGSARDLLSDQEAGDGSPQLTAAREWLIAQLIAGDMRVTDVMAAAQAGGHAWRTVRRAQDLLGIKPIKRHGEGWLWHLPPAQK